MQNKETTPNKTGRTEQKPATVTLHGGTVIDAAHHFTSENNRVLHLYIDSRDGGIDVSVPLTRDGTAWARTPTGERALGITQELVADGGARVDGHLVEYDGEMWKVGKSNGEWVRLYSAGRNPNAPTVVETDAIDPKGGEDSW